jgi:hypothetical protein
MAGSDVLEVLKGTMVKVKGKAIDLENVFHVEEADLSKEFMQQASMYAYFATAQADAEYNANMAELNKDQEEAAADSEFRAQLDMTGKKYTEAVIRGLVVRDEAVSKSVRNLNSARYQQKLLKAICSALEMRAQMLQSLGSHLRHEYEQTGLNTRENQLRLEVESVRKIADKRK